MEKQAQSAYEHIAMETVGSVCVIRQRTVSLIDGLIIEAWHREVEHATGRELPVVFDLTALQYLSSSAMGALLIINKKLRTRQLRLSVCGVNDRILEVFQITKTHRLLNLQPTLSAALAFIAGRHARIACPVHHCGEAVVLNQHGNRVRCPGCSAWVTLAAGSSSGEEAGIAAKLELPTYDDEQIVVSFDSRTLLFTVRIEGRLDLFSSTVIETAWRTIPVANNVVLDLSQASSVSEKGLDAVLALLQQHPNGKFAAVEPGSHLDRLGADLKASVAMYCRRPNDAGRRVSHQDARPIAIRSLSVTDGPT